MSAFGLLFVVILVVLLAMLGDYYSRLKKMGWAPEAPEYMRGRSLLDPVGAALGEVGRADLPYRAVAAVFDVIGKFSEMLFSPIGAVLNAIGKASEMIIKPITMVLGLVSGAKSS